jgi:hypothetical protein
MNEQYDDVELALNPGGNDVLFYAPEDGCTAGPPDFCSLSWEHATLAIGSAVEARIPYAELDAVLPPAMQGKLTGSGARSFVRVRPHTIDYPPPDFFYTEIDDGAAVASFRLVTTPYAFDPPLAPGGSPFTALPNPLPGLWYVGQGPFSHGSHSGYWGYDLHKTDAALHPESPAGSTNLVDHFSFGQPILAPVAGTVYSVVNNGPDHPPYDYSAPGPPNFLFLQIPGNIGLLFSHTKQGTIPFAPGHSVAANALVGRRALRRRRLAAPALRCGDDSRAESEYRHSARDHEREGRAQPDCERPVAARRGVVGHSRGLLPAARARRRGLSRDRRRAARAARRAPGGLTPTRRPR